MCGITGIIGFGRSPARPIVERMNQALAHRGPDEHGSWGDGPVVLAARRLRIVDLANGHQPLASEDGSIRLVANGEIYNADELRAELQADGHTFATHTDIEVILHAYEADGPGCLARLEGMFAFALWDGRRRRLLLARDRFGEKPLYYAALGDSFAFASELKALLVHPGVRRELDADAVARYLAHEYVPAPYSIFRAVRKLRPAHWMTVAADGAVHAERYWTAPSPRADRTTRDDAADATLRLLDASVRSRLARDVPWGTFLSGGIDSSLVTALAAGATSRRVKTFAIGFDEDSYDERSEAAAVARVLGTDHREVVLRAADAPEMLAEAARVFDEPFADASALPALAVSRLAREHVTVVLSGDGGDELFCGYPTQTAHRAASILARTPQMIGRMAERACARLPSSDRYLSFDFALRRFIRDAWRTPFERHLRWMGSFTPEQLPHVLARDTFAAITARDPYAEAHDHVASLDPRAASDVATALDLHLYLADDNLVQWDRAAMATALEVRAPFLDRGVAEFALRLPAAVRRGLWETKPVLRRAARGVLPPRTQRRAKHGFGVPNCAWLRGPLRSLMDDALAPDRLRRQGIFDPAYVTALRERHVRGIANHRKELWTLLTFQLWADVYLAA